MPHSPPSPKDCRRLLCAVMCRPAAFSPAAMARSETTMWRHYYERRYISLFADLYDNSRAQYGFSPWDSVRIAAAAARADRAFQLSTSRTGAKWRCRSLIWSACPGAARYRGCGSGRTRLVASSPRGHRSPDLRCDDRAGFDTSSMGATAKSYARLAY